MKTNIYSKIPRSFSELKKNKNFAKLLQICKNDNRYNSENNDLSEYYKKFDTYSYSSWYEHNFESTFFLPYRAQIIYLIFVVLNINFLKWDLANVILPLIDVSINLYPIIQSCVFVISIIVCIINMFLAKKKRYMLVNILNIAIIIATWYFITHDAPFLETFALSTAIQILLTILHSLFLQKAPRKELKKLQNRRKETHKQNEADENFYNETVKEIETNWETSKVQTWWKNSKYMDSLANGEHFLEEHKYVYTLYKVDKYDYYNPMEQTQVKGSFTDDYTKIYTKNFIIHEIPEDLRESVEKSVRQKKFVPLYPVIITDAFRANSKMLAIECICHASYYAEHNFEQTKSTSPSSNDIDAARARINEKYDDKERLHNLIDSGIAYTNDEMINRKGLTKELWEESEINRNLRETELNNYISDNTKLKKQSNSSNRNHSKIYSEILMYIIDDYIFFNPYPDAYKKQEKDIWIDKGFELNQYKSQNYYASSSKEREAAIYYLLKHDLEFAHRTVERLLHDNSQTASRIMHTFAQLYGNEYVREEEKSQI